MSLDQDIQRLEKIIGKSRKPTNNSKRKIYETMQDLLFVEIDEKIVDSYRKLVACSIDNYLSSRDTQPDYKLLRISRALQFNTSNGFKDKVRNYIGKVIGYIDEHIEPKKTKYKMQFYLNVISEYLTKETEDFRLDLFQYNMSVNTINEWNKFRKKMHLN